ncbi:MAG: CoA ester lyase [Gammaproteobacteria bacterium]|nr:MAG: CoA ester lyase [Gammaproteobacteria bacterium]
MAIPRSWLFVPGDRPARLQKALRSGAEAVICDLEDAVLPTAKADARREVAAFLASERPAGSPPLWVRINGLASNLAGDDLDAIVPAAPAGVVLPKPDSVADVARLDEMLAGREVQQGLPVGSIQVLAVVTETAHGVTALPGYVEHPARLVALSWGAEDLSAELGAVKNRDAHGDWLFTYRLVRSLCQLAAAAAGLPAIETVFPDFRDLAGLQKTAAQAFAEGFSGMLAIHPDQVPVINAAFSPSTEQLAEARRVVAAFAASSGAGAVQLDGRMLDRPHLQAARRLLEMAR